MQWRLTGAWCLLLSLATPAWATTLSEAASALAVGAWTSITPTGKTTIDDSLVTSYGMSASYDVIRRQINFVGSVHPAPYDHIIYDDSTNAYLAGTGFSGVAFNTNFVGHGFDGNTHDPRTGDVFYLCRTGSCGGSYIYKKPATSTAWTALAVNPLSPDETNSEAAAMAYFPEMAALIVVVPSGRVYRCNDPCTSTSHWVLITTIAATGSFTYAEYNPVRQVVIFGSAANNTLYKMTSSGTVTNMGGLGVSIYDGSGYTGHITADPVSGVFIILTPGTSHTCRTYEVDTNSYGTCTNPPAGLAASAVAVPINHYGVIAYIHCGTSSCQSAGDIYLYKHATSEQATNDFNVRCSHPSVLHCVGFNTASDVTQNVRLFPNTTSQFNGELDSTQKASGASSLKFTLPAGSSDANMAGYWRSATWSQTFSQNSHFYAQYQFMITNSMLTNLAQWNSEWKIAILHFGGVTCGGIELTSKVRSATGTFHYGYTDCGATHLNTTVGGTIYLQQGETPAPSGAGYWCPYPDQASGSGADCYYFQANKWYTIYWDVTIGTWGSANSTIKVQMAEGGGAYQTIVNLTNFTLSSNGTASEGYNTIDLLPYMTALSTSANTSANIWYDDLIVSTSPIVAPGAVGGVQTVPRTSGYSGGIRASGLVRLR